MAKEKNISQIFLPVENTREASLVDGVEIFPVKNLVELVMHLNDQVKIKIMAKSEVNLKSSFENEILFESIKGHSLAKRACEIAVAGFDNLLLKSPPGVGKTLLSKALASIMPPLEREEIIEVIKIYSVDGLLKDSFYITKRPFRAPHHTTSRIGWWAVAQIPPRERYPWPSEEFCF